MNRHTRIDYRMLGIDVSSQNESELFRWFLACMLFGKPIRQEIAADAYARLTRARITDLERLAAYNWHRLVALLDDAKYVRYDFSTATKLIDTAAKVKQDYGSVQAMVLGSKSIQELMRRIMKYKGIGPVTASIFAEQFPKEWFTQDSPDDYDMAQRVVNILHVHGFEAYFIGGAVRDMLLGRIPKDFDIVTNATPAEIVAIPEFALAKYNDPAQAFGVTRVRFAKGVIEIATFRKDVDAHTGRKTTKVEFTDLWGDVSRRDLTINALAFDPFTNQVIDYVDGIEDLERRIIRFIGDPRMRMLEDPLRIMRAVRLKNHLDFSYHESTASAIRRAVAEGLIAHVAIDRMRDELTRMLVHPSRRQAIVDLDMYGILGLVLPEVTAGKGVMQQPEFHAEGDVWAHQLLILDYVPDHPSRRLAWAALLHDIGKPATRIEPTNEEGRVHFDRHYAVGAELAKTLLRRLRFSNQDIRDITWMIYNHMSIDDLPAMRPSHQQRMMSHPAFADLLELHRADALASWRQTGGNKPLDFGAIEKLWREYRSSIAAARQKSLKQDLGIDGDWLLSRFGHQYDLRGPVMGRVLRELNDWYIDEGVTDTRAYVERTKRLLAQVARTQ